MQTNMYVTHEVCKTYKTYCVGKRRVNTATHCLLSITYVHVWSHTYVYVWMRAQNQTCFPCILFYSLNR
jgi:hypothetical protein